MPKEKGSYPYSFQVTHPGHPGRIHSVLGVIHVIKETDFCHIKSLLDLLPNLTAIQLLIVEATTPILAPTPAAVSSPAFFKEQYVVMEEMIHRYILRCTDGKVVLVGAETETSKVRSRFSEIDFKSSEALSSEDQFAHYGTREQFRESFKGYLNRLNPQEYTARQVEHVRRDQSIFRYFDQLAHLENCLLAVGVAHLPGLIIRLLASGYQIRNCDPLYGEHLQWVTMESLLFKWGTLHETKVWERSRESSLPLTDGEHAAAAAGPAGTASKSCLDIIDRDPHYFNNQALQLALSMLATVVQMIVAKASSDVIITALFNRHLSQVEHLQAELDNHYGLWVGDDSTSKPRIVLGTLASHQLCNNVAFQSLMQPVPAGEQFANPDYDFSPYRANTLHLTARLYNPYLGILYKYLNSAGTVSGGIIRDNLKFWSSFDLSTITQDDVLANIPKIDDDVSFQTIELIRLCNGFFGQLNDTASAMCAEVFRQFFEKYYVMRRPALSEQQPLEKLWLLIDYLNPRAISSYFRGAAASEVTEYDITLFCNTANSWVEFVTYYHNVLQLSEKYFVEQHSLTDLINFGSKIASDPRLFITIDFQQANKKFPNAVAILKLPLTSNYPCLAIKLFSKLRKQLIQHSLSAQRHALQPSQLMQLDNLLRSMESFDMMLGTLRPSPGRR